MAQPALNKGLDIDLNAGMELDTPADYQQESRGYGEFEPETAIDVGATVLFETEPNDGLERYITEADAASLAANYKKWLERYPDSDRKSSDGNDESSFYNRLLSRTTIEYAKIWVDVIRRRRWEFLTGCLGEEADELGLLLHSS